MRHAVVDAALELDPLRAQPGQLLQPRLAARHADRDVVDRDRVVEHRPFDGRLWQVGVLAQRDIVVVHAAAVVAAIEAHLAVAALRICDLLEAEGLGPEFVRLLDVAHVDDEMVDTARGDRLVRDGWYDRRGAVRHHDAPSAQDFLRLSMNQPQQLCHRDPAALGSPLVEPVKKPGAGLAEAQTTYRLAGEKPG
jgi:hypothetical protein